MTPEFAAFLGQFGLPITILVIGAISGARGIWVWGRELQAAISRAEAAEIRAKEWQIIALKALNVGEKVIDNTKDFSS
jgi:hypothetical protein